MGSKYLVQQPKKLESVATRRFGDWIAMKAEKLLSLESHHPDPTKAEATLSRHINIIQNYLECNIPGTFYDKLMNEAERALLELESKTSLELGSNYENSSQRKIIWRMIEIFFSEHLTFLRLYSDRIKILWYPLYDNFHKLNGLTHLELICTINDQKLIIPMLENLTSLISLTVCGACLGSIICCVAEKCENIQKLKIEDSYVDDEYIIDIARLYNLRSVDLGLTGVSYMGIVNLLMSCETIEHIVVFQNNIAKALEHIASITENAEKQFDLKCYSNCSETTYEQLKLIVRMCPQIQKMYLSKTSSIQGPLTALNDIKDLQKLKLSDYDFYGDQVKEVLESIGCSLLQLCLEEVNQMDLNALVYIAELCPNLESLSISYCDIDIDRFSSKVTVSKIPPFKNLKKLMFQLDDQSVQPYLFYLLSNSTNIEFISSHVSLTDEFMLNLLSRNPLVCLKQIKMINSHFSAPVIDRIIESCPNLPEVINYTDYLPNDEDNDRWESWD